MGESPRWKRRRRGKEKGKQSFDHSYEVIISGCCEFYEIYTGAKLIYYYY